MAGQSARIAGLWRPVAAVITFRRAADTLRLVSPDPYRKKSPKSSRPRGCGRQHARRDRSQERVFKAQRSSGETGRVGLFYRCQRADRYSRTKWLSGGRALDKKATGGSLSHFTPANTAGQSTERRLQLLVNPASLPNLTHVAVLLFVRPDCGPRLWPQDSVNGSMVITSALQPAL